MGVHCVIYHGHQSNSSSGGVELGVTETMPKQQKDKFIKGRGKKLSSKLSISLLEYLHCKYDSRKEEDDEDEDDRLNDDSERATLKVNRDGALVLPSLITLKLPNQKDAIRQIVHKAYSRVPWALLQTDFNEYI
ncbi:hypothetical protein PAXINDRAFT_158677 [Paxillus involutus ATCC 200175]|uniref:Uncharacterized protein n=1 Tax=Paxillus involutus ATCC 200175 TaxID=664439 RepID=A0A0C9TEP9_PAXIN|nr:hypothetical protein PAXINDRAFT_158677 [Paxillus involutus ATCC 200175]